GLLEFVLEFKRVFVEKINGLADPPGILVIGPADDAWPDAPRVVMPQRLRGVLDHLPEGGAAVAFAIDNRPHVEMSVNIDHVNGFPGADITEIMSVSGLMPPAHDDRNRVPF